MDAILRALAELSTIHDGHRDPQVIAAFLGVLRGLEPGSLR
jgi:hypothetical protein